VYAKPWLDDIAVEVVTASRTEETLRDPKVIADQRAGIQT